jgi:Ni,Fe-hydrogenase III small subunit
MILNGLLQWAIVRVVVVNLARLMLYVGAVSNVIPVDMTISGCPPTSLVLLKSLLSLMEK